MEILKLINVQMVITQIVCFFLVLFLLKKFLWKPVFTVLEERRERVKAELAAVETAKADVQKLKNDYAQSLAKIDETAQLKFREIERQAEARSRELKDKARQDADHIIEDSRKEITFEITKAREALRRDVVGMVVTVTEKMILEKLTYEQDRQIIEKMLTEMDKTADAQPDHR
ncbi:MAG: F0F1 ATP synthase subunit B [Candidatus Omnitrophica bacterium]|nr:F0F1 ATP synthase subunit B [Candidatus Omnitrophota bacterium]